MMNLIENKEIEYREITMPAPQLVGKIYKTYNYDIFKFMDANRPITELRKNKIRKSVEDVGYISAAPIIVNEFYEIVDGQCRFSVCKDLELPIYFTMRPGAGIYECISMNISATSWSLPDYISSYAAGGNQNYIYFETQIKNYPNIPINIIAKACSDQRTSSKKIKEGKFTVNWGDLSLINELLDFLSDAMPTLNKISGSKREMCNALIFAYKQSDVDKCRLKNIIGRIALDAQINTIGIATMDQMLQLIEDEYNKRLSEKNKIWLVAAHRKSRRTGSLRR